MEEELVVGFGYRLFDIINYWIHFFIWDFLNDKILYQKLIDFLENVKIDEFLIEANTVRNFLVSRVVCFSLFFLIISSILFVSLF